MEEETIQPAATLTYGLFENLDLAVEYEISEALELVGNIGVETNKDKASDTPPAFLLGGIVYIFSNHLAVDFGVRYRLTKPETDWAFLAGITLRFYCALNGIRKILHNNVSRS